MKKISFKKTLAAGLMAAMVTSVPLAANAASGVLDTIYGTATYNLSRLSDSENSVRAYTTMGTQGAWVYLQTTLEVQVNSTGATLFQNYVQSWRNTNYSIQSAVVTAKNLTPTTLAAFSAHEVVGDIAYVRYLSSTF